MQGLNRVLGLAQCLRLKFIRGVGQISAWKEQDRAYDELYASAVVYTMVEIAKAHDLNIYGYLKFLLEHRPAKEMTDDQLAELAPWSEKLQSFKNHM